MAAQEIPFAGFVSTLLDREEIAEGTMAFHFGKPAGFTFKPGQATDVTLVNPPETDSEGNIRTFSIASPPYEDRITIATRIRNSAFKRSLKNVPIGTAVNFAVPGGSFTLHKNASKPAVFLAGGIGITPFLSIVCQADHDRLQHKLSLFYSNRRPEDAAFLDRLQSLAASNPNFQLIATMTRMASSSREWKGEVGFVNGEILARHLLPDFELPSSDGQRVSLYDWRGHLNLVLFFARRAQHPAEKALIKALAEHYSEISDTDSEVILVLAESVDRVQQIKNSFKLPFPVLSDTDVRIHTSTGAVDAQAVPAAALYITDRFLEVFADWRTIRRLPA